MDGWCLSCYTYFIAYILIILPSYSMNICYYHYINIDNYFFVARLGRVDVHKAAHGSGAYGPALIFLL